MTERSRNKQIKTTKERYGDDHYASIARKRWEKPGEKEKQIRDDKGKFVKKGQNNE